MNRTIMPTEPLTGLLGHTRNGLPIWPVRGGADEPPPDPDPPADPPKVFTQDEVNAILAREKRAAKPADYEDLKKAAKRLEEIESANASDLEKAVKAAREEGRAEVQSAANARLISAEARAVAAEMKFKNPSLAIKATDLSDVSIGSNGDVDTAAIRTALEALATDEPYLVGEDPPKPPPSFGGGPRLAPGVPTDPRATDLAQIEADIKAGTRR